MGALRACLRAGAPRARIISVFKFRMVPVFKFRIISVFKFRIISVFKLRTPRARITSDNSNFGPARPSSVLACFPRPPPYLKRVKGH